MYDMICTQNDVLRERFITGAELVGNFGFPKLEPINADVAGLKPVPFHMANKEKNPRQAILHCFLEDYRFETLWREPLKSIDTLLNFKYVCPCDFSVYSNMPLALQIYNVYRDRAIHHFLTCCGVNCIPVVVWSDDSSFDWCFDGLPQNSTYQRLLQATERLFLMRVLLRLHKEVLQLWQRLKIFTARRLTLMLR